MSGSWTVFKGAGEMVAGYAISTIEQGGEW